MFSFGSYNQMTFLQKIKKAISSIDMFYSTQMLRYNQDTQYKTTTGGIITLGMIIMVTVSFLSMISQTLNKTAIDSNVNILRSRSPPELNLVANKQNMFMFGIQITSIAGDWIYDLNGPRRFFDLTIQEVVLKDTVFQSATRIQSMVACTDEHWSMYPDFVKNKDKLGYNTWLCPQINSTISVKGNYFSEEYRNINIRVLQCTNASDPSRPCQTQQKIDQLFSIHKNFMFAVNYVNAVINPSQVQYLSYYIQSQDYTVFSATQGNLFTYSYSDYTIQTDNSYWPFQDKKIDRGAYIRSRSTGIPFDVTPQNGYIVAFVSKSPQSFQCQRKVQKMVTVFSFIGGLVGAISTGLFLLKAYTDTSLQVSIALAIFKDQKEEKEKKDDGMNEKQSKEGENPLKKESNYPKSFNILSYLKLTFYKLLKRFKFANNWTEGKRLSAFQTQIGSHLDIRNLLRRITNLQNCISYVFDDSQLNCLKHQQKIGIQKAKKLRTMLVEEEELDQGQTQMSQDNVDNVIYHFEPKGRKIVDPNQQNSPQRMMEPHLNPPESHPNASMLIEQSNVQLGHKKERYSHHLDPLQPKDHSTNNNNLQGSGLSVPKSRFISRKTVKNFTLIQKKKDSSLINQRIWENANQEIKKYVLESYQDQKSQVSADQREQKEKLRTFIQPSFPSIMITPETK